MDLAEADEIKALLRKAQEARGCKGPLVLLLLLCVFFFFFFLGTRELLAPSFALSVRFTRQE